MQVQQPSYSFPVRLEPVFTQGGIKIPRTQTVVRTDTGQPLSTVGMRYQLYTHEQVMNAIKPFTDDLGPCETKHYLERDGARLIATHTFKGLNFHLPQAHKQPGETLPAVGDVVALQVHVINSYNRSSSLEFKLGGMVLRCLNGMTIFNELFNLRYAHLPETWAGVLPKPDLVMTAFKTAGKTFAKWSETPVSPEIKLEIEELAVSHQIVTARQLDSEETRFVEAATGWDLHNAYSYVLSHSVKAQKSGQLRRLDRLNAVFQHVLNPQQDSAATGKSRQEQPTE